MVPGCHSGKEKKQKKVPPNRMINQNFLKLLINTFKNFSQNNFQTLFSEKVKNGEDEILVDMVASELKSLSCSILKVKFKHEVNNLFFKYQKVNYKKMLTQIPNPISTQHLLTYNSPPPLLLKVMVQYSCRTRLEEVQIVRIQVCALLNGTTET